MCYSDSQSTQMVYGKDCCRQRDQSYGLCLRRSFDFDSNVVADSSEFYSCWFLSMFCPMIANLYAQLILVSCYFPEKCSHSRIQFSYATIIASLSVIGMQVFSSTMLLNVFRNSEISIHDSKRPDFLLKGFLNKLCRCSAFWGPNPGHTDIASGETLTSLGTLASVPDQFNVPETPTPYPYRKTSIGFAWNHYSRRRLTLITIEFNGRNMCVQK